MLFTAVSRRCFSSRCCSGNQKHGERGHSDEKSGLLSPIGQRRRYGCGRDDRNWKVGQCPGRSQAIQAVDRAGQPHRAMVGIGQDLMMNRTVVELRADHCVNVRIARQQRSVAVIQGNRGAVRNRHRLEKSLETGRRDRSGNDAQELAIRGCDLVRDDGCPTSGETALQEFDQKRRLRGS